MIFKKGSPGLGEGEGTGVLLAKPARLKGREQVGNIRVGYPFVVVYLTRLRGFGEKRIYVYAMKKN